MKKVIFLDIDGVLNCNLTEDPSEGKVWLLDPIIVKKFNKIFDSCKDVDVVLSSSWRHAVTKGRIDINQLMEDVGYTGPKITEYTPDGEDERGYEIQAWLDNNKTVEKFVIIDDNDDMLHLLPHLIETNFWSNGGEEAGLTNKDVERIISIFNE